MKDGVERPRRRLRLAHIAIQPDQVVGIRMRVPVERLRFAPGVHRDRVPARHPEHFGRKPRVVPAFAEIEDFVRRPGEVNPKAPRPFEGVRRAEPVIGTQRRLQRREQSASRARRLFPVTRTLRPRALRRIVGDAVRHGFERRTNNLGRFLLRLISYCESAQRHTRVADQIPVAPVARPLALELVRAQRGRKPF